MKIWILFLQWSKCIPVNLKGAPKTFNEKFEWFYVPHSGQIWQKLQFLTKLTAIWDDLKCDYGVIFNFCLNGIIIGDWLRQSNTSIVILCVHCVSFFAYRQMMEYQKRAQEDEIRRQQVKSLQFLLTNFSCSSAQLYPDRRICSCCLFTDNFRLFNWFEIWFGIVSSFLLLLKEVALFLVY